MDLEVLHPLCHEQESSLRHLQRNRLSQGRKTCFTCRKAERGQAQPQLYGTSYFFVKMALIGQIAFTGTFLRQAKTPAQFKLGLEEMFLQPSDL
jgi:hypothetical protein